MNPELKIEAFRLAVLALPPGTPLAELLAEAQKIFAFISN